MIINCKLNALNERIGGTVDLFICAASFESRCLSVSQNIELAKIKNALIFYTKDSLEYSKDNLSILYERFGAISRCVELILDEPLFSADKMLEALVECSQDCTITSIMLDVTTFTHESLLILLRLIPIVFPLAKTTYIYANAQEYDSGNETNNKWLSKGIGEIRSVLGYPGEILPTRRTHLIVIVGYEFERAANIIDALEPSMLSLAFGRSDNATTEKNRDANEHYISLVEQMASSYQRIERFEVKCDDPFETCRIIESNISDHPDMNIVIVPLNNKITTLGVAFAAISDPSIQLIYAPALVYNYTNYSSPGDGCYIITNMI